MRQKVSSATWERNCASSTMSSLSGGGRQESTTIPAAVAPTTGGVKLEPPWSVTASPSATSLTAWTIALEAYRGSARPRNSWIPAPAGWSTTPVARTRAVTASALQLSEREAGHVDTRALLEVHGVDDEVRVRRPDRAVPHRACPVGPEDAEPRGDAGRVGGKVARDRVRRRHPGGRGRERGVGEAQLGERRLRRDRRIGACRLRAVVDAEVPAVRER